MRIIGSFLITVLLWTGPSSRGDELKWFKGNTHTHTLWSDGDDFPESVVDWYKRNGYDFLVLSDHNILSRGEHWKSLRADEANLVMDKAARRWGKGHVETRIHDGKKEVRLLALDEIRGLLEEPGNFILIEGVELTAKSGELPVHTNPMNVSELLEVQKESVRTVSNELAFQGRLVHRHREENNQPVFWQVNHPNFKFAITGEQLAEVEGLDGVEIMNSSSKCFNLGDGSRPSVERLWDIANTLRLKRDGLPPLYGTATDDTHNYHLEVPAVNGPGTAWVMVESPALTPAAITRAMQKGDFYSSTGVSLDVVKFDESARSLEIEVDVEMGVNYRIQFIGTPRTVLLDSESQPPVIDEEGGAHPVTAHYLDKRIGMVLAEVVGNKAVYQLKGDELFVRAVVHCDKPPHFIYDDSSDYEQKAWTQPVGWSVGK